MAPEAVRELVQVPKDMHGKVIGRGAATLKDIQSDYPGVRVTVPKRDDPSDEIVIEGPPTAVAAAKARVLDICGMAPNVAGAARAEAQRLYDEADALFEQARAASGEERSRLYDLAHAKRREAEAAQLAAARKIFEAKNLGYGNEQMDLHGLHVKEALTMVEERLVAVDSDLRSGALPSLTIITGFGHHSDNNRAKIKPEVARILTERGYPFEADDAGGLFIVSFEHAEPAAPEPQDDQAEPAAAPAEPAVPMPAEPQSQPQAQPQPHAQPHAQQQQQQQQQHSSDAEFIIAIFKCMYNLCFSGHKQPEPDRSAPQQGHPDNNINSNNNHNPPREQEMNRLAQA